MSVMEMSLNRLGILPAVLRVCEDAGISLAELEATVRSAFASEVKTSSVPDIMALDTHAANGLLSAMLDDLGGTLSGEEVREFCPDC